MIMVSIIVPVYNSAEFLHKCIKSIQSQTYSDFELLLINDGSTDQSGTICDSYSHKDSRIKVYHKDNEGTSSARNYGIEKASGEYICFIDSDDYVKPDYVKDLYDDRMLEGGSSLVFHAYSFANSPSPFNEIVSEKLMLKENFIDFLLKNQLMRLSGPCGKLFQKGTIIKEGIRFPQNIHMGEDAIFILSYLYFVDKLVVSNKCNYIVCQRAGSLSSRYNSFDSEWLTYITWKESMVNLFSKWNMFGAEIEKIVWENTEGVFMRSIQCDIKTSQPFYETKTHLKSIPQSEYDLFKRYYHPNSIRKKLNKYFIINKSFYIYFILNHVFHKIKK